MFLLDGGFRDGYYMKCFYVNVLKQEISLQGTGWEWHYLGWCNHILNSPAFNHHFGRTCFFVEILLPSHLSKPIQVMKPRSTQYLPFYLHEWYHERFIFNGKCRYIVYRYTSPIWVNILVPHWAIWGMIKFPVKMPRGRNPQGSATETETEPPTSLVETATETDDVFLTDDLDPVGKLCLEGVVL